MLLLGVGKSRSRSGGNLDIRARVGVSSSPTVTGSQAITGVGFQPKAVLPFGTAMTANGSDTTLLQSFGAFTASQNASVGTRSTRDVTTSVTARHHNSTNAVSYIDGALTGVNILASRQSLDVDGFTLNHTALDGVSRILNHICLGGSDLEVSLTQHQMNDTNAPQSFAHGLSGAPTSVLFFSTLNPTAPPHTRTFLSFSIGMWSQFSQYSATIYSDNGVATTLTRRTLQNNSVINNIPGTGVITRSLSVSSVDASNVNCTYPITTANGQAYFFVLAIRGAKCQTGTFNFNGSTSPITITTPGITPKLFLPIFVPLGVQSINTIWSDANIAIGACDGTNTVSCGITDRDGQTTTNTRRFQSSTSFQEYNTTGTMITESTAVFSGQSVVITPTTVNATSYGQAAYLIIGS